MFDKVIDLTLTVENGLKSFPSHPAAVIMDFVTHEFSAPRYELPCEGFASKLLIVSDHLGTHVDAPVHFIKGGKDISSVDINQCMGRAYCFDFSNKQADAFVTESMLKKKLDDNNIVLQTGDIVLIRAWPGKWGEEGFFSCQGLDIGAAKYLYDSKVKLIGMDLGMVDIVGDKHRPIHMMMLGSEILLIENLVNLDKLPDSKPFFFIGLPLKLSGCTASPIRAVAILDFEVVK